MRPGLVLQDGSDHRLLPKCAGDLVIANKERLFLARSMWNHVIFCVRSHNQYLFIHIS